MGKMKILIIIPTLRSGGAERVVSELSAAFTAKEHDILIVTFSRGRIDYPVNFVRELGVEPSSYFLMKIMKIIRISLKLRRIKREFSPDISLSFMFAANLTNVLSRVKGELVISSVRTSVKRDVSFITKLINYFVYYFSYFIVAVSNGVKQELMDYYMVHKNKVETIYNFVNNNSYSITKKMNHNSINLITMGRLEEVKGQWLLIYAVDQLKTIYPYIRLSILGEGALSGLLKDQIKELKLEENVILMGFQKDTMKYLHDSDIFCLSSRYEGMPNSLLEAMSYGLPVISTDIPHGPKEILNPLEIEIYDNDEIIIKEKYGLLVDYGNKPISESVGIKDDNIVRQFVHKIQLLIENKELYSHYSSQSLRRANDFSKIIAINQWLDLFKRLTNK